LYWWAGLRYVQQARSEWGLVEGTESGIAASGEVRDV